METVCKGELDKGRREEEGVGEVEARAPGLKHSRSGTSNVSVDTGGRLSDSKAADTAAGGGASIATGLDEERTPSAGRLVAHAATPSPSGGGEGDAARGGDEGGRPPFRAMAPIGVSTSSAGGDGRHSLPVASSRRGDNDLAGAGCARGRPPGSGDGDARRGGGCTGNRRSPVGGSRSEEDAEMVAEQPSPSTARDRRGGESTGSPSPAVRVGGVPCCGAPSQAGPPLTNGRSGESTGSPSPAARLGGVPRGGAPRPAGAPPPSGEWPPAAAMCIAGRECPVGDAPAEGSASPLASRTRGRRGAGASHRGGRDTAREARAEPTSSGITPPPLPPAAGNGCCCRFRCSIRGGGGGGGRGGRGGGRSGEGGDCGACHRGSGRGTCGDSTPLQGATRGSCCGGIGTSGRGPGPGG